MGNPRRSPINFFLKSHQRRETRYDMKNTTGGKYVCESENITNDGRGEKIQ